jgi:WD40 repeat protein
LSSIKFGPQGYFVLLTTKQNLVILLSSSDLKKVLEITDFVNDSKLNIEASFTPDESYLMIGSEDGHIRLFEIPKGKKICELNQKHTSSALCVKFNHQYMMLASSCKNLIMWIPTEKEEIYEVNKE